jgi:hypothetical protein
VALIRCTCLYGTRAGDHADEAAGVLTVVARDPWCPAAELHARHAAGEPQSAHDGPIG